MHFSPECDCGKVFQCKNCTEPLPFIACEPLVVGHIGTVLPSFTDEIQLRVDRGRLCRGCTFHLGGRNSSIDISYTTLHYSNWFHASSGRHSLSMMSHDMVSTKQAHIQDVLQLQWSESHWAA